MITHDLETGLVDIDGFPLFPLASEFYILLDSFRPLSNTDEIITATKKIDRLERDFDNEKQARLLAQNQIAALREEVETADTKNVLRFLLKLVPTLVAFMGPDSLPVLWEQALQYIPMSPERKGQVVDLLTAVTNQVITMQRDFETAVDNILEPNETTFIHPCDLNGWTVADLLPESWRG